MSKSKRTNYKERAKQNVPANALYDETTSHIFVEDNGKIVEKKYCTKCKKWHTLDCFGRDKKNCDGLNVVCKTCDRLYQNNRNHNLKEKCTKDVIKPEVFNPVEDLNKIMNSYINSIITEYRKTIDGYVNTIKNLENELQAYRSKGDINKMTTNELEKLLMTRKDIQPRVLFNAIKNLDIDDKWVFYCKDNTTGMTYPIKPEVH